ncbi:MAG: 50S ribosomal protein L27 [bacterium]|nr:50S ribosomal protein L27 [bacterium]
MADTKSAGMTTGGRNPQPKYLGIKMTDNQGVRPGMIIIRQRGTKFIPGKNVRRAGDDSLYAAKAGVIKFSSKKVKRFDGSRRLATIVSILEKK